MPHKLAFCVTRHLLCWLGLTFRPKTYLGTENESRKTRQISVPLSVSLLLVYFLKALVTAFVPRLNSKIFRFLTNLKWGKVPSAGRRTAGAAHLPDEYLKMATNHERCIVGLSWPASPPKCTCLFLGPWPDSPRNAAISCASTTLYRHFLTQPGSTVMVFYWVKINQTTLCRVSFFFLFI